ncbi:MAG TPA: DNA double-strand break repair nuclease NurA [Ignisphaera sp.]|nr:DNA double-strand break repair nuclease NurA [Ignisphaera sp.]
MLPQTVDKALTMFGVLRSKIDESLLIDGIRKIRSLWKVHRPNLNPYVKKVSIGAVDSGYNYTEYRGYALYVVNAVWIAIEQGIGEAADGIVDIDVSSSSSLELELSILSIAMELEAAKKILDRVDILLIDGSLIAKFFRLLRAKDQIFDIFIEKKLSLQDILRELIYLSTLYSKKVVFISKNSNAKDVLGYVKGDIYYFERYTEGQPGFSKPMVLEESRQKGTAILAKIFSYSAKDVVGIHAKPVVTYVRLEPFSRVYRIEFVAEEGEDLETRVKYVMDLMSPFILSGYPYPLLRADQLARVSDSDLSRIVTVLGIVSDPYSREPL